MPRRRRGEKGKPWLRKMPNGTSRWYIPKGATEGKLKPLVRGDGSFIDGKEKADEATRVWHGMMAVADAPRSGQDNPLKLVLDLYLQRHLESNASGKTFKEWLKHFKDFIKKYPDLLVRELQPSHLHKWWLDYPTWGSSMKNYTGTALMTALNWAAGAEGGLIDKNPLKGMKMPRVRSRGAETLVDQDAHKQLMAVVPEHLADVLDVLRDTGTRPSNVRRVEARNFLPEQGIWLFAEFNTPPDSPVHKMFKKTGESLTVPLTDKVIAICNRLKEKYPEGPLFRTARGEPWTDTNLASSLYHYKKQLGLQGTEKNVMCYGYRHTVATDLLENDVPDATVAAVLGQKGTDMIYRHYSHLGSKIKKLRDILSVHRPAGTDDNIDTSGPGPK